MYARLTLAAFSVLSCCHQATPQLSQNTTQQAAYGDSKLQVGEACDDGNSAAGDGCNDGVIEAGYLCHVPGQTCSLASLCGNNTIDSGEACDDGNTTLNTNACSANCDLSLCGNGVINNRQWPNFDQELCDDGNRIDGDGCTHLCEAEPGFACAGSPSRCVTSGVVFFSTGVDSNNVLLRAGADPHWIYAGTTTGAVTATRSASDWPNEMQTSRFMAASLGAPICVYQDFLLPSTIDPSLFRLRIATFNDNTFDGARINGSLFTPITVSEPPGQPWQKNIVREFGVTAPWRRGLNRVEICNENAASTPNAFRYRFAAALVGRCGDGVISSLEVCDDGGTTSGNGCNASCEIEAGMACVGQPSQCAATCGNGVLNPTEACDDGNADDSDGCSNSCRIAAGFACAAPGTLCVMTCGNGALDPGEACDDDNVLVGDGCSPSCRIEQGYGCVGVPSVCGLLCGNAKLDAGETCDDGDLEAGDGCSAVCTRELGYACATPGQACVRSCGDGEVDPGEACDDGDLDAGDGCSSECVAESGFACSVPAAGPSVCVASCGDAVLDANEACDDGNVGDGDGCSSSCRVDLGFSCLGSPSTCSGLCGDGYVTGTEQCDDANAPTPGCSALCQLEPGYVCVGLDCFQTCGNGTLDDGEQCDDGGLASGDGCSSSCTVEGAYVCFGAPSACTTFCGDGVVSSNEACDDGNLIDDDDCSNRCLSVLGQGCTTTAHCAEGVCSPVSHTCIVPDACVVTSPLDGSATASRTVTGTASGAATIEVFVDTTVACTATADAAGVWACALTTIPDGAVSVVATATLEGISETSSTVSFVLDTQAPDTSFSQTPPASTQALTASFAYAASEANVTFECSLDDAVYVQCVESYTLSLGAHTLRARAVDAVGNADASPAEHTWSVVAPLVEMPMEEEPAVQDPIIEEPAADVPEVPEEPKTAPVRGCGGCSAGANDSARVDGVRNSPAATALTASPLSLAQVHCATVGSQGHVVFYAGRPPRC